MYRSTVAGLVVLLAACTDNRAASTIPTSSAALKQKNEAADTRFGANARPTWSTLSDAEKRVAARTTERAAQEQGDIHLQPQIVLLDRALPHGAVAMVTRNPDAPAEPIIVVRNSTVDAHTMERAFAALEALRRSHGTPAVRTLHINALGEITVHPTELAAGARRSPGSEAVQRTALGAQLAQSAASVESIEIPGLGSGTVLRFR